MVGGMTVATIVLWLYLWFKGIIWRSARTYDSNVKS
jgi:hypothetical protein